nr:MAG TPA: hyaluronidase [Caudoviricetes sp.]
MAQRQLNTRIIIRNDTSANWTAANPVLLKGELGIENDTGIVKCGDGVAKWESAQILNESNVVVKTAAPTASDSDYKLGTLWLDTTNNKAYLIYSNTSQNAVWKQVVTPDDLSDLGAGDMLKSQFANNPKADQGYVNAAIKADSADAIKNSTPSITGNLMVNDEATGADAAGNNALWTANKIKTELDKKQETINLTPDRAVISGTSGALEASTVTKTELGYLSGVTSGIQEQINNIPKYNYLTGVSTSVADGANQSTIDTAAIAAITAQHTSPAKWDACDVQITFTPSDVVKDAIYYYNGSAWVFLYYSTTGVQVANGDTAGIVESSDDINFVSGKGTISASFVKNTQIATTTKVGVVKASTGGNNVNVDAEGVMTVGADVLLSTDTYIINGGGATV